jgi:hypothetical protein
MAPRKPKSPEPEAAPQPKPRVRRKAIPAPPSLPEPPPARKPSRRPLWIAFGLAGMVILAVSALWVWARGEAIKGLDAGAEVLRRAGYEVTWKDRSVGGYPFRINVALEEPRIRDRSGWALEAPRLEAQAFLHAPGHWLAAAPDGATFTRPEGGPVRVNGKLIRASLTHLDKHPPNLSFEGVDLTFEPAPGAQAFGLASAGRVEFHLRRAPAEVGDEAGVWLSVKDGKARLPALLGRLAGDKPVSLEWDGRMTKIDALRGENWRGSVRAWSAAGGAMRVTRGGLTAGDALVGVNGGTARWGCWPTRARCRPSAPPPPWPWPRRGGLATWRGRPSTSRPARPRWGRWRWLQRRRCTKPTDGARMSAWPRSMNDTSCRSCSAAPVRRRRSPDSAPRSCPKPQARSWNLGSAWG